MKVVGIVAEYNPFHIGHAYLIQRAKELTGADYCVIVMSGDYVQRGTPAIIDKYLRAEMALKAGADLVLELPVYYSLGSAEYFASGAVALLDKLGVVDSICFGSECGNVSVLSDFADALLHESDAFKASLQSNLKFGYSYPVARNNALIASNPALAANINVLSTPNNILAIEYCKAIAKRNSSITSFTVPRTGSSYHNASLEQNYSSALAIREALLESGSVTSVAGQVPDFCYELLEKYYQKIYPITTDDFSLLLQYQLFSEADVATLTSHPDIDDSFAERILKYLPKYDGFNNFCELLKSKNRTYTRISRSMMHILLHITENDLHKYISDDYIYYAKMLGFKNESSALLSEIKTNSTIPLLSKLADSSDLLDANGLAMLNKDLNANRIYQSVVKEKFHPDEEYLYNEYQKKMLKI